MDSWLRSLDFNGTGTILEYEKSLGTLRRNSKRRENQGIEPIKSLPRSKRLAFGQDQLAHVRAYWRTMGTNRKRAATIIESDTEDL